MKYIKTKNSIWTYEGFINSDYYLIFGDEDVVAQADTIEELCDEFVIHYAYGFHLIDIYKNKNVSFKDDYDYGFKLSMALENHWDIYGAIWTDKGLIYVAKMNNEGELELL